MQREFGPIKRRQYAEVSEAPSEAPDLFRRSRQRLIIDGYNLIFSWPELKELALSDMDLARSRLLDMLENTDAGTGLMHEGVFKDDPAQFTRPWFAWANSIFSEFVEKAVSAFPIKK
jgi:hypothetical protein